MFQAAAIAPGQVGARSDAQTPRQKWLFACSAQTRRQRGFRGANRDNGKEAVDGGSRLC